MSKYNILIPDNLSNKGVTLLEDSGLFDVYAHKKMSREDLLQSIDNVHGLIIRSATHVDTEVLELATNLKVVIRAGVGVDNINIPACSAKGIVVMNAPIGNAISTAEQAIALIFALARKISQANQSMKLKKWEKNQFAGSQITGKTLGVIGLGRIGKEVVKRAQGLGMSVLGYDPFIPQESLEYLQIQIVALNDLLRQSDYITVHTPLTKETASLININNLSLLKPGVRLINCARGGIYSEEALAKGLESGHIGGVGLDVYIDEPPKDDFILYQFDNCIMTPHLGASTKEAQLEVAKESATSMISYFCDGIANNSLNFPTMDPEEMNILMPWFNLCEKLGNFLAQIIETPLEFVRLVCHGELGEMNTQSLGTAVTKGILQYSLGSGVNMVSAPVIAKNRGLSIVVEKGDEEKMLHSMVSLEFYMNGKATDMKGMLHWSKPVIASFDGMVLDVGLEGHVLVIKNRDVPKVVGEVGSILGEENLNIASLKLGRKEKGGEALLFIQLDNPVTPDTLDKLVAKDYIIKAHYIHVS